MRIRELKLQSNRLLRSLVICSLVVTFGVAIGWATGQGVLVKSLLVGIVALLVLFLLPQTQSIKIFALQRTLLYFTIVAGVIGSAFLAIPIGPIHLFPYRVLLPLLWLFFVAGVFLQGRVDISYIKVRPYLQFLGLWLIYAVLSLGWAASKDAAVRDIIFLFMGVSAIFFITYYMHNLKDLRRFYNLWLLVLIALVPIGLWETMTGNHLAVSKLAGTTHPRAKFMPTSVFYNPNDFATYLAVSIPFLFAFIRYHRSLTKRIFGLSVLCLGLYLVIMTFSRANYLAVLLEIAFLFIFLLKIRGRFKVIVGLGLLLLFLVFAFPNQTQSALQTLNVQIGSVFTQFTGAQGSGAIRLSLLKHSLALLTRTAGFGVGAGNAECYMVTNPHNWWVEIWTNYGIWFFAGYLLFYFSLLINLYKARKGLRDKTEKMICEALLVALVGFFFASISSSSIMALRPQWFLFAFALAFLNYVRNNEGRPA